MKNSFIVLAAVIMTGISASCQGIKVPDAVKNAFASKFPNATNVKWGKENAKELEAGFKLNNTNVSANFGLDGSWVETETMINASDLPAAVTNAINVKYPGNTITRAEKLEKPGGKILYETVIKVNGKKREIEINPDGSFVK
jgi:hypothetical protein